MNAIGKETLTVKPKKLCQNHRVILAVRYKSLVSYPKMYLWRMAQLSIYPVCIQNLRIFRISYLGIENVLDPDTNFGVQNRNLRWKMFSPTNFQWNKKSTHFFSMYRASLHSLHRLKSKLMMSQRRSLRQPKGIRCVGSWAPAPRRGTKGHKEQWSSGHIYTHQMGKCIENQPALRALSREKGQFENLWRFT